MASHQSPVAARSITLLLLLVVVPFFTTAELEERKPHVKLADEGSYKTYIVQLKRSAGGLGEGQDITGGDADAHRAWHQSFLPSMTTALGKPRLLRSYRTVFTGFAALLTEEELEEVSTKPGFMGSFPSVMGYLQTTPNCMGESPKKWADSGGPRAIVSVVGGGIDDFHPSLEDNGEVWKGSCRQDMKCNDKLIGTKNMYSCDPGYLPLNMENGHVC